MPAGTGPARRGGSRRMLPIRDRRTGAGGHLRHRLGRPGHHLHVVGHLELRLRRHRVTSSRASTTTSTPSRAGPSSLPAVVSIVIAAPALGVFLYAVLFRHLRLSSPLIKVVATIGLLVAIPSVATLIFGNQAIQQAPGLAPEPVHVFQFLGVPVTLDQVIVYVVRGGHRGDRGRRAALHRGRPQGAGHGRLAGHDRPVGHQPDGHLRRGLGGQPRSSPDWPACSPPRSSASTPATSRS